jgi:hypothetical protein
MPRPSVLPLLSLALLAACGGPPQPAARPLDDLAAKPDEVRAKLDRAEAEHADALKRAESEATEPPADAESR